MDLTILVYSSPTGIQTPILPLEGSCPIQLNDRTKLLSEKRDSNSRPPPWQGDALPTELFSQFGWNQTRSVHRDLVVVVCFNPERTRHYLMILTIFFAGRVGLEPTIFGLTNRSLYHLSFRPINNLLSYNELCVGIEPTSLDYKSSTSPFMLTEQLRVSLIRFT